MEESEPEASCGSQLVRFGQAVRRGILGALFVMGKETNPSRFAVTLAIIVDTCQLLSFPLSKQFGLWSTRDPAAGIFLTALEYTNFSVLVSNQTAFSVVFFSLLVLTAGLVVNACYVGYCFARQEFTQFVTLRTLRIFSGLAKIGYVPALFVLLSAMRCSSELLDDTATCAAIRATTGLNLVGFVVLSCFFTSSMFDSNIRSMSPLARSDARSDLLQLLMRTVLVAQATLIRDVVVSLVTCGVASVLLILSFGFRLPYYDVPMMALKLASMAMLGWASIFTALQYVVQQADQDDHDSRSGLIWAFLLSAPFVCYAAKNFVSWRLERLTSSSIDVLSRPSEVLVKIRCTLREQIERSGRTGTGTSSAHTDSEDSEQDCIRLGGQLFEQACTKFPKSVSLWIARSTFMLFVCKNDHLTLRFVDIASRLDPYIDHAFLLYRIKRLLEDNVAEGGKALVNYLSSEKYLSDARAADIVCCQNLDDFWSELIRRHPSQARLMKLAERISTSSDVADQNYKKLMKLSNKSASLLMNYAGFLRDVLNDPIRSQSLLLEARTLQREKVDNEASAGGCGDTDLEGRLSDVGVIVVSDSGEVHSANSHFCRIFGYSKSHIVGRDINSIIPEPIKSVHQRLMARYLTTGQSSVIGTTRKLVGIDSQGFLVPILIRVKSFVHAAKELRYIGIFDSIYPREASGTQVLFGLEYESRFQYLSRDFARLLNLVNGFGNNGSDRLLDVPLHKVFAEYHDQSDRSERLDALEESEQQDKEAWRRKLLNSPLGLPVTFADTVPDCMLEALRPRDSLDRRDSFIAVGGNNSTSTGMRSLRAAKAWCVRLCVFGEEVHVWRIAHRDSRFLCKTPEGGHSNAQNLLAILDGLLPRSVTQNNEADDLALAEASLFGPSNLSEHTNKYADVSSVESDSEFSGAVNKHVLQKQHIVDVETDESQSLLPQSSSRSHSGMKDMSSCSDRTVEMTQLTRAVSNESAATVLVQSDEIDDDISSCCPKGRSVGLELPKVDSSNSPPLKPRAVSAVHVLDEGSASTGTTSGHSSARASSVVSATSYASTTTTVNTTYHIRKTLMANSSTRMHTYRKAFLLCVGVFSVIVITLMLVILSKLEHLVDGIVLLAQVRILSHFNVVAMTHDVTTLMLKSHNVLQQGDSGASMSAGTVDFTQNGWNTWEDSLVETAAAQHELLQQFEYEFKNYGNADAQRKAHHAVSTAVFSRFRDIEVDSLPLNLLTHQYLGFVREFLALNDSERRAYPPELNESLSLGTAPHASSTFLVVNVGPTAASETSPIISNLRKSEQKFAATLLEDTRSHASHLVLPLWIASGVLTFMLLFGPSLSLARQVSLTKKQVLCAFLEMPAKMCESLAMRAQMRLRHTHAQEEVIATSEDEFGGSNSTIGTEAPETKRRKSSRVRPRRKKRVMKSNLSDRLREITSWFFVATKLTLPLLMSAAFVVGWSLWLQPEFKKLEQVTGEIRLYADLMVRTRQSAHALQQFQARALGLYQGVGLTLRTGSYVPNPNVHDTVTTNEVRTILEKTVGLMNTLSQGGTAVDGQITLPGTWKQSEKWRADIDAWTNSEACINKEQCHSWLQRGLREGVEHYAQLGFVLAERASASAYDFDPHGQLDTPAKRSAVRSLFDDDARFFRDFERLHLTPATVKAQQLCIEAARNIRHTVGQSLAIGVPVMLLSVLIELLLFHRKTLRSVHQNLCERSP